MKHSNKILSPHQMRVARAACGVSQEGLADLIYSNRVTIAQYERGQYPHPQSQVLRLATQVLVEYDQVEFKDGVLNVTIA